jgi:cobalt-zinc-cadmium efflux system membrane fusion protein
MPDTSYRSVLTSALAQSLSRKVQVMVVVVMAAAALVAFAVLSLVVRPAEEASAAAAPEAPGVFRPTPQQVASLKTAPIVTASFRTEEVTDGNIAINDDHNTPVFSPYSGRVTRLIARLGDVVKPGQPLFGIDASEFVQGQNDLVSAVAAAKAAQAQLLLSQTNAKRQTDLFAAKAAAQRDVDQSQADLAAAQSNARSADIALAAVRNRLHILGKSDAEIQHLEGQAARMSAEALVPAPIGGTVIQRQVGVGEYITSGSSNPVYSIGDLSTVWLVANVREAAFGRVHIGDRAEVRVLAYPGRVFNAKISFIGSAIDPNTRRLPVRADVENPDGALLPNMFASFAIITGPDVSGLAVPEQGVLYEGSDAHIWIMQPDKTIALREIHVGRVANHLVQVLDGAKEGEVVVTRGALFIDRAASGE